MPGISEPAVLVFILNSCLMEKGPIKNQFFLSLLITIFFSSFFLSCHLRLASADLNATNSFPVGLVLDLETPMGEACNTSISMAFEDFYASHRNYTTRVILNTRNSKNDVVGAASAALDLLKNVVVQAIIGPTTSVQARFIIDLGNKTQVPIISFSATSPSLSHAHTPYFVRTTLDDSKQVNAIVDIINNYGWKEVVPIYEDTEYGAGIIPFLTDALFLVDAKVPYHSIISPSANDDQITAELYKLMSMQTRVFVVNMAPSLGSRLFMKANMLGMISEGYVWIITDGMTNLLDSLDPMVINSMQGVLGLKPYVQRTGRLDDFSRRWRKRLLQTNPNTRADLSVFALRAYDTAWALAMAAEKARDVNSSFTKASGAGKSTDLDMLGSSVIGPRLLDAYLNTKLNGMSGEFYLIDGQLQTSVFQVLNVNGRGGREIGFWKLNSGLSRRLKISANNSDKLGPVIWPGEAKFTPKGWEIPTNGKELVIGVPKKDGFREFLKAEIDPVTNRTIVSGYCIDVFEEVIRRLPYAVTPKYVPFVNASGESAGSYNDMIDMVYYKKYDAVVGDVTIRANRSRFVDFTLPFTESGISMIVPVKKDDSNSAWIFFKPWTTDLWVATFAFFLFTGFMVWVIEHRINPEFRGPLSQQIGIIFYFAFSTLVFAHKEKVLSNLARFAVIIWILVVLILTSSYTASLTSFLTVKKLQPTVSNVDDLLKSGDFVGYQEGSFVLEMLKQLGFHESKLKPYGSLDEYAAALSQGSQGGGVAAIFDEIAYIRLVLSKYDAQYTMVGPTYKTNGFGFVFPIGSPLVTDLSREILNVTQGEEMILMENKWFGDKTSSQEQRSSVTSNRLSFKNFWGLFLLTGITSGIAIILSLITFVYSNSKEIRKVAATKSSIGSKVSKSVKMFDKKDPKSHNFRNHANVPEAEEIEASLPCSDASPSHHTPSVNQSPTNPSDDELDHTDVVVQIAGSPTTSSSEIIETGITRDGVTSTPAWFSGNHNKGTI